MTISQTGDFRFFFQNSDRRHSILTVATVKEFKLRHSANFPIDRSNRYWDMAMFQFFKTAAATILDF